MAKTWTHVLVTVGSTRFDKLLDQMSDVNTLGLLSSFGCTHLTIQYGSSGCPPIHSNPFNITLLSSFGCTHLTIQYGSSGCPPIHSNPFNITVNAFDYKTSIMDDMMSADVVIGHADPNIRLSVCPSGAGTALEVLRLHKPFLMVVNDELMANHQKELAIDLQSEGYLRYCYPNQLQESLRSFGDQTMASLKTFPDPMPHLFSDFIDSIFFK
ncbi:unnamed protein product, partial [Medioppia subpectinata]